MKRTITPRELQKFWLIYIAFRQNQVSPSTYKRDYTKVSRVIEKLRADAPGLKTSIQIRDWLLARYAAESARRYLMQFNAACTFAWESDMLTTNPFKGIHRQIRKQQNPETQWAAFTPEERDRIIQEFEVEHPFYAPWVKLLFWTGARPEELAALRWEHISSTCQEILFAEAFPVDMPQPQATKNRKTTRFPCNNRLQGLLRSLRIDHPERTAFVCPGRAEGRFNYQNFQTRYWRPLVQDLVERGHVSFYLSQYHARHTWITLALEHLSVADVAYLARVSTTVLYKHYAGRSRKILIPEF